MITKVLSENDEMHVKIIFKEFFTKAIRSQNESDPSLNICRVTDENFVFDITYLLHEAES